MSTAADRFARAGRHGRAADGHWEGVSGTPRGTRPTVVLVDDSKEVRAVVRRLLQSSGFDVVGEGGDGDEAILLAFRHEPALLLLDTSMPKVDGIEALPAILALSPETRVVMFTGFEEPGLAARARELGAVDFVEKSLRLEDLAGRLMRTLGVDEQGEPAPAGSTPGDTSYGERPGVARGPTPPPREQAVLSEHVQQFRELFDRAELGMATLTSSGTIVRANRALAALMSCSPDDLVGVDYGRLTLGQGDDLDRRLEDISNLGEDLTSFEHDLPAPLGQRAPGSSGSPSPRSVTPDSTCSTCSRRSRTSPPSVRSRATCDAARGTSGAW